MRERQSAGGVPADQHGHGTGRQSVPHRHLRSPAHRDERCFPGTHRESSRDRRSRRTNAQDLDAHRIHLRQSDRKLMAAYAYTAINIEGFETVGEVNAPDLEAAREQLRIRGLLADNLRELRASGDDTLRTA